MTATLIQMMVVLFLGIGWRVLKPAGINATHTRLILTQLVYYVLSPALVLSTLWKAQVGIDSLLIASVVSVSVLFSGTSLWLVLRRFHLPNPQTGALILAVSVPNITYLGLPILEKTFGPFGRSIAIQVDLFGCVPWLFTLGIVVARHYGQRTTHETSILLDFCKIPPVWAAIIAVVCNLNRIAMPLWLANVLNLLSPAVVPLMLLSLGMGLQWQSLHWQSLLKLLPVLILKLAIMPFFALYLARYFPMHGNLLVATILEMAMPCMMFGIVFCDKYHLDSTLYSMAVTLSTLLSVITLPLWYSYLSAI